MAGHAEAAHGSDRASQIMKFDGLPGKGKPIVEDFKRPVEIPVLGKFVSTMYDGGASLSPLASVSSFGDSVNKPKFTAKITLVDTHSNDNF